MTHEPCLVGKVSADDVARARDDHRAKKTALRKARCAYLRLRATLLYAQLLRRLRTLANRVEGKPYLALILGVPCCAVTALLLVPWGLGLMGVLAGATVAFLLGWAAATVILHRPHDSVVTEWLDRLPRAVRRKAEALGRLRQQSQRASEHYRELQRALVSRQNRLLHANWRALAGGAFEGFLAEVFEELGYAVRRTKASGDQGVDLILVQGARRIAVQAKGYTGSVGNKAVQEVYTGMRIYKCDVCAVVTNSEFTPGAREAAAATGCILISGNQIPALILGKLL